MLRQHRVQPLELPGKAHHADWLFHSPTGGTGNPGNRKSGLRLTPAQPPHHHLTRRCFTHRAKCLQGLRTHTQHVLLCRVTVGHKTSVKPA